VAHSGKRARSVGAGHGLVKRILAGSSGFQVFGFSGSFREQTDFDAGSIKAVDDGVDKASRAVFDR
jgi:hypothetical protein